MLRPKRNSVHPRLETLESRQLLSAGARNSSARGAVEVRTLGAGLLAAADAQLPSSYWIYTLGDSISKAGASAKVPLPLTADRVSPPPGRESTAFDIRISPESGSAFNPGAFELLGPTGRPVTDISFYRSGNIVGGLVRLAPGNYTVVERGMGKSTGWFMTQVNLVGDETGDREVTTADVSAIKSLLAGADGSIKVTPTTDIYDLQETRRITAADLKLASSNVGAQDTTVQYLFQTATTGLAAANVHVA